MANAGCFSARSRAVRVRVFGSQGVRLAKGERLVVEPHLLGGREPLALVARRPKAAEAGGSGDEVRESIRQIVGADKPRGFVSRVLAREIRP